VIALLKIVALWLLLALAIASLIYRINVPHYRRLKHGFRTHGVVTALEPGNHQSVRYQFEVGGRSYSGVGSAGFGNPDFESISVGSSVIVYYLSDNPNESCLGIPDERIDNEVGALGLAAVFFPILAIGVLTYRFRPFREWLLRGT
jgi:hypothetical protein